MIINDIKINGFKNFNDQRNLKNIDQESILSLKGSQKRYVFSSILGIIFGFKQDEKRLFKSESAKVFTGSVILNFDQFKLHIDRDFETDIVAVLSQKNKKWMPLFQGKDFPEMEERKYNSLLSSFFSIIDKGFLLDNLKEKLMSANVTLGELIDSLFVLLNSRFKAAAINTLLKKSRDQLNQLQHFSKSNGSSSEKHNLENSRDLILNYKKILKTVENLRSDIAFHKNSLERLENGSEKSSGKLDLLKQRFPLIYHMDAKQVKDEIYELINLRNEANRISKHVNKYNERKAELEGLLKKLLIYSDLPASFENDFKKYQQLSVDLAHERNLYDQYFIQLEKLQTEYAERKKIGLTILFTVPLAIAISMFIFFPQNIFYSIALFVISASGIFFLTRVGIRKLSREIDKYQIIISERKRKIKTIEKEINILRQKSFLLDDVDYIDTHIKKFKKHKQVQKQLEILKHEIMLLQKNMRDKNITETINRYEKKYKDLIDLNREDLVDYISGFEQMQRKLSEDASDETGKVNYINIHKNIDHLKKLIIDLETLKSSIEFNFKLDGTIQSADYKIKKIRSKIELANKNISVN